MTERPIIFSGESVRRILNGTKTQTRRIVRVPPWVSEDNMQDLAQQRPATGLAFFEDGRPRRRLTCPFGTPGDVLWVREVWGTLQKYDELPPAKLPAWVREGKGGLGYLATQDIATWCQTGCDGAAGRWRSPLHMPRWASRLTLIVMDVRVQQLHAITDDDARAEGITDEEAGALAHKPRPAAAFADKWNELHGKDAWDINPWIWAVTFARPRTFMLNEQHETREVRS